jgi:PBP1b-binding outer membrane lipoprotein LpoB
MKKFKIFTLIILSFIFLESCGSIKEGFSSQKKNSSDEFLVEKKSPLVMPPNFDELPTPKINEVESEENSNNIKSLITTNEDSIASTENNQTDQNLENSILKKIKNN